MCRLSEISRVGYYRQWKAHKPREEEAALRDRMQELALMHRHYGYRRIGVLLRREGWQANNKRLLRLMRVDNLLCLRRKAFVPPTTDSKHSWHVWPNLTRGLQTTGINQVWVADITYVRLSEEFVYVAVVLDAHSRCVAGWAIEKHLGTVLAIRALKMALARRTPEPGMIHHSDRGIQYACGEYVGLLLEQGIQISMSRVGNPYDNAKAESFMKTLKQEEVNGSRYRDLDELRKSIRMFLEEVYNGRRLHSALDYMSPAEFEAKTTAKTAKVGGMLGGGSCPLPTSLQPSHPVPNYFVSS
jgi:putative transposase